MNLLIDMNHPITFTNWRRARENDDDDDGDGEEGEEEDQNDDENPKTSTSMYGNIVLQIKDFLIYRQKSSNNSRCMLQVTKSISLYEW